MERLGTCMDALRVLACWQLSTSGSLLAGRRFRQRPLPQADQRSLFLAEGIRMIRTAWSPSDMQPHTFGANNGRSQCALRRTGMNDTMCQNQSQYCPFCGSFAKSPPSWQKKQGTPLRSNCFIRCRVKVMLLVLQSQGMGTIFSKPSR
jgi:hypothetical protein